MSRQVAAPGRRLPGFCCVFGRKRVPRLAHTQNALSGIILVVIISNLPRNGNKLLHNQVLDYVLFKS